MGVGWELYGIPAGLSQQQWDRLTQKQRDDIKAFIGERRAVSEYNARHAQQNQSTIQQGNLGWPTQGYYPQAPPEDLGGFGDGGFGGGGGGGFQTRDLASSPEWLAYLNALGYEENQFRADIDRQRAFANAEGWRQVGEIAPQYQQQREQIGGNFTQRGAVKSGAYLRAQANSRANEGRAYSNVAAGTANTLSQLESALAQKLMDLNARRADKELSLRSSGYV